MNLNENNYNKICEIESSRDITILHGGMGGYKRYSVSITILNEMKSPDTNPSITLHQALILFLEI